MNILVTNDDGIKSEGLWSLARELKNIGNVIVVAPDSERSAIGTALTLSRPLRVSTVAPELPGVKAYTVDGTPADSVVIALENLARGKVDLVVSGINQGLNLGNDVLISGTVSAALQGFLRGFPALAVSMDSPRWGNVKSAARVAAVLAGRMGTNGFPKQVFLNVNLPDLPLAGIKEIRLTRLAGESHVDTVEEGEDGSGKFYQLVRRRTSKDREADSDIRAIEEGVISVTPLHIYRHNHNGSAPVIPEHICSDILREAAAWR